MGPRKMAMVAAFGTMACTPAGERAGPFTADASFMTDDLLKVAISADAQTDGSVLRRLADCAAADAAQLREAAFMRHVRTVMSEEAGIRRADAVYTVSLSLPDGPAVIDVETMADACKDDEERGI